MSNVEAVRECREIERFQREREEKTQNDLSAVFSHLWNQEHERQKAVMEQSGRVSETARQLAVSAQAHLTRRDSTDGMSIMAGFPFFGDWGRDTMIAFYGCMHAGHEGFSRDFLYSCVPDQLYIIVL